MNGFVFQDGESGQWHACVELPRKGDGKRNRRRRRAGSEAEAEAALEEMLDELARTGMIRLQKKRDGTFRSPTESGWSLHFSGGNQLSWSFPDLREVPAKYRRRLVILEVELAHLSAMIFADEDEGG